MRRLLLPLCLCLGCHTATPSPRATLARFVEALNRGDAEAAYALMSSEYRARVPLADFRRRLNDNPAEVGATARALSRPRAPVEITARVRVGDGEGVVLVREDDGFHLRGDVTDFYPQDTPARAARSFVRAMRARRYDVVLRFVPLAEREGITEASLRAAAESETDRDHIAEMLLALESHLSDAFEVRGDYATLSYAGGRTMRLIHEESVWRVESPE